MCSSYLAPRFDGRLIPVVLEKTKDYPWILDKFPMIQYRNSDLTSREIAQALRGPDRKGSAPLGLVRQRIGDKVHRQPNPQI